MVLLIETKLSPGNEAGRKLQNCLANEDDGRNVPTKEWLTREEAARYLTMSRTTLNKMLNEGKMHFRMREVGNCKQLLAQDVIPYKQDILRQLDPVKSEMVREAQELGLYGGERKGR